MRGGHTVAFAIPGQADLYGYVRGGRTIEVELKKYGERLKPDQELWETWCLEWEIPHIVLTGGKNETIEETINRWCLELQTLLEKI